MLLLRDGVEIDRTPEGHLALRESRTRTVLRSLSPGMAEAVLRLAGDGSREEDLTEVVLRSEGVAGLPVLDWILRDLSRRGFLAYRAVGERGPLVTATPAATAVFQPRCSEPGRSYVLSRFAFLRRESGRMVIESPVAAVLVAIQDTRAGALVLELAVPRCLEGATALGHGLAAAEVQALFSLLLGFGLLAEADSEGSQAAEETGPLAFWELHDLLSHAWSRFGRHRRDYGGSARCRSRIEPLPVTKPQMSSEGLDLDRPDLVRLNREDVPLTAVLERRRSIRDFGDQPLTLRQLGELLFRAARLKDVFTGEMGQQLSHRPYPGAGAAYELEIYLTVDSCAGLPSGLYHYCPSSHRLFKLAAQLQARADLLRNAALFLGRSAPPPILLTVTARFGRVFRSYASTGYATILKDVGILFQTLYLVGEAMGLAICALGGGDADLFAAAAGIDYYAESSVGEMALGSRRTEDKSSTTPLAGEP